MIDLIGYPKYVLNSTWLNEAYADIEIQDDFLMNVVSHKSFIRQQELLLFYQEYSRGNWIDFSPNIATANAYYSQTSNTMIVPIAMLQPPLFWTKPQSLTFGAFGIIVGEKKYIIL
ncbi:ECE [Lepeophtheirus salmonis]|uniref:ECE n=1 Tax=Lepeophtheirus salmonis TaxID=72036 RepID=A0A7R8H5A0_LEPSM|nr:ECE [Lepeophtheirus salmonis]CAF2874838.1 ECE [Lepeophtheirus salmonis]